MSLQISDNRYNLQGAILLFEESAEIDETGNMILSILRHNGLPSLFPVIVPPLEAPLKVRAASKKLAASALEAEVSSHLLHISSLNK